MAVAFDAVGTDTSGNAATTNDNSTLTVGSGSNRALIVFVTHNNVAITAETVRWDPAGANQLMTLIGTQLEAIDNTRVSIYGLVNPASGNKIIRTAWTGTADFYVCGVCFTGVDQTGGATSFPGYVGANGSSTTASVTVTSAVGDLVVGGYISGNANYTSVNNTQIFLDTVNTNTSGAANRAAGAASVVMSGTLGASTNWAAGGNNIKAVASGVTNFDWQPFVIPVLRKNLFAPEQQFLAFVKAAPFPETVTESRWHQPWAEPPKPKLGLGTHLQPFQPYEETARFPEVVSEDRWHQPWSEPSVKSKPSLPVGEQQFLAAQANPIVSIPWFNWLSEPVRAKPGLSASGQQFLALAEAAPFPETVTESRWHQPWSEPVRQKVGIAATEHPLVSFDPFQFVSFSWFNAFSEPVRQALRLITGANPDEFFSESARFPEIVSEDRWHQPWSEPVRRATNAALQSSTTFTAIVTATPTASVDGWGTALSTPQRQLAGLTAPQQQFLAFDPAVYVASVDGWASAFTDPPKPKAGLPGSRQQALALAEAAPFPEAVSEDRFHQPWSEPVRTKVLPASEQQTVAFAPVTTTQVFEDSWHQRWTDPIQLNAAWKTGDNSVGFIAVQSPVPSIDGWGSPWSEPPKAKLGTTAALQQFLAFAPFVTAAVPSVDGWAQPWSTTPKPKISVNVAAQQALAFDPAVFTPSIDGWQNALAEPVRIQPRLTSDAIFFPPNFTAATVPPLDYFLALSEPQRQRVGLAERFQQMAANGFVPIVPPFVFFFGNEEPLPWPGFRGNQFIRENYDSFALPPFPIPNPPQTQAKFTVSGPSVSDLFPVSGVVYPYAPETRKTVP